MKKQYIFLCNHVTMAMILDLLYIWFLKEGSIIPFLSIIFVFYLSDMFHFWIYVSQRLSVFFPFLISNVF